MKIPLPPKRWESADSPEFDVLRHKKWFTRGQKRKHQIPPLKQAAALYNDGSGRLVKDVCVEFNVNEREFRDWYRFHVQKAAFAPVSPKEQVILNAAYAIYCDCNAEHSYSTCIEKAADYYNVPKRPMRELWEVNPNAYPAGYKQLSNNKDE